MKFGARNFCPGLSGRVRIPVIFRPGPKVIHDFRPKLKFTSLTLIKKLYFYEYLIYFIVLSKVA